MMTIQELPALVMSEHAHDKAWVEFVRRSGFYSMDANHYHNNYEIYYLFSGRRRYFIKDRTYAVEAGDLVIIDSNEVHKTGDVGIPNHERVLFYYDPAFFGSFSQEEKALLLSVFAHGYPVVRLNLQERLHVETLFLGLLTEMVQKPPGYVMRIRHAIADLLLFTARILLKRESIPADEPTPMQQKITDIVRHINTHYSQPIDLNGLSQQFFISKSHLSRVFKEVTGFGFAEYVNITRVRQAQMLLRESTLSVMEVSQLAGFDNFSHFGKVFKRLTGLSPRQYRSLSE